MEATRLSDDERDRLADFLNRLHALLERLLNRRRPLVADKDLELLRRAWAELEAQERFTTVRTLIQAGEYDFSLANHGLRGDQLRLKVGLFERAADELERKEGRILGAPKRVWPWALRAANVVVDSVAIAVPPAAAINEFKDAAEVALEAPVSIRARIVRSFRRLRPAREEAPA